LSEAFDINSPSLLLSTAIGSELLCGNIEY
jgi:hypothetical protein